MWLQIALLIFTELGFSRAGYDCVPNCYCEYRGFLLADCGNANYSEIPQPEFTYPFQALYAPNNKIAVLRDGEFLHLSDLKELVLQGNIIHTIEVGAFDGLERLQILDLSRNHLSSIPSSELSKLSWHLRELSIAENAFDHLPDGISTLISLSKLDFSGNELISDIPPDTLPPFLKELRMSNTGIKHMRESLFVNQTNLKLLEFGNVAGRDKVIFEDDFFDGFPSLEFVGLSGHTLGRLPSNAFSRLASLKALILANCDLHTFPELYTVEEGSASEFGNLSPLPNGTDTTTEYPGSYIAWHNGNLTVLDLSHNPNITIDPEHVRFPPMLTDLRIGYTNVPVVDKDLFRYATKIERLDLEFSNIEVISTDAFINMRNLSEIQLSGNPIEAVPRLPGSLTILAFHTTGITNLTKEPFSELQNVVEANFSHNQIESIHDFTFGHMVSLRKLDLSNNKFEALSKNTLSIGIFHSPHHEAADTSIRKSRLSELILSNGMISKIQERAFESHTGLKRLYLQMNHLVALQQGVFVGLEQLLELNLNDNEIADLSPRVFKALHSLETLWLGNNKLEVIFSETLADLLSLRRLYLKGNSIKIFHATTISSLEYIDFSKNQISELPHIGAPNLNKMDASLNSISRIGPKVLRNMQHLRVLNLSYCELKHMDYGAFANIGLVTLDLTGNRIDNFLDRKLLHLEELFLAKNQIKTVDSVSFLQNVSPIIERLDLSYNLMEHIDGAFFHGSNHLQSLNLTGNRFACDCRLLPLVKWMRNNSKIREKIGMYTCGHPPESISAALDSLDCHSNDKVGMNRATMYIVLCIILVIVALILVVVTWCLCKRIRKRSESNVVGLGGGVSMVQPNNPGCSCCCFGNGYSRSRGRFASEESRDLVEHATSPVDKDAPIPL